MPWNIQSHIAARRGCEQHAIPPADGRGVTVIAGAAHDVITGRRPARDLKAVLVSGDP